MFEVSYKEKVKTKPSLKKNKLIENNCLEPVRASLVLRKDCWLVDRKKMLGKVQVC